MADQRPGFRFRLPWLPAGQPQRPSFPPRPRTQPTATTTPTPTPQTAAPQLPPAQPTITTTTTSTTPQTVETQVPPMQPTTATPTPTVQTAEKEAPPESTIATTPTPTTPQPAETQNQTQPDTSTITPISASERPPFRPPGLAPSPQASRTQSKPPSPSRSTTQPASPAPAATQSRAPSQPSTPPRATPQPRAASLPSSPSRRSPQLPSAPQTGTQPKSPSLPAIRASDQTSSLPSPSKSIAQGQTKTEAVNQLTSPPEGEQGLTKESSQPTASSTEVVSSMLDIPEPKSAISESPSQDLQTKAQTIPGEVFDSRDRAPLETGSQLNEMKEQPSEESFIGAAKTSTSTEGTEAPPLTQKSETSTINPEPESLPKALKPDGTKEVNEVMQGTKDKTQDDARYEDANIPGELSNTLHTKGTNNGFQSEHTHKTVGRKEITATSTPNGRQTKVTAAQPKNKNMAVDNHQKLPMLNGEHIPLHKEIREDISKIVHKVAAGESKHSIDDRPVSVVTLAGENRGATMHLGSDSFRKEEAVYIHRGYMIKPDDSPEAKTDGEESFKAKSNNPKSKEDQAPEQYVNSNIQGINNSMLFNSSISERNAGVRLIRSNIPTESKKPSGKPEVLQTRKAEFNMTPSQKLTHEPVVRRRCLRGLFLESSDSDLDSTKPRSHGCRVGCNEKREENNIDIL